MNGDGTAFAKTDDDIANGMPAVKAAEAIVSGLEKQKKEINVGQGLEMIGLYIKRFFPAVIFKMMAKRALTH